MNQEVREVRGRIPKELKIELDVICARLEMTQAAAVEEAIRDWLKKQNLSIDKNKKRD